MSAMPVPRSLVKLIDEKIAEERGHDALTKMMSDMPLPMPRWDKPRPST